jgi:glutathione S-transferase
MDRCKSQILGTLDVLEGDRAARPSPYWLGPALSHPDVAFTCAWRFTREAHPGLFDPSRYPALSDHAARCESLEPFRAVYQAITNNL